MAKFIQVPTTRAQTAHWRINIDHIVTYDGTWVWLAGERGKISQTVSSDELDHLIKVAESDVQRLIPSVS